MPQRFLHWPLAVVCLLLTAADWPQFRGPKANGISQESHLPKSFSPPSNIAWTAELPGQGISGPIVIGKRVVVTASSGYRQNQLHVLCFHAETGQQLWHRQFWATGRTTHHPKMSVATPTPASDGQRIFAFYSSNDLACLDLQGRLLWYRGLTHDYPNASNSLGMASSPLVLDETLIVQVENEANSFAAGLNPETGENRWMRDRPRNVNWTSPSMLTGRDGRPVALLQSSEGLTAVEPATGDVRWSFQKGASSIPSSVVVEGTIYVPSRGITALAPPKSGDKPEVLWQSNRFSLGRSSPVAYQGHIYTINMDGVLTCGDARSGKRLWQIRLQGPMSATPVLADNHLYYFSEKGLGQIVKLGGDRGQVVAEHDFGEPFLASPAAADGAIYIRSEDHLWKIGSSKMGDK